MGIGPHSSTIWNKAIVDIILRPICCHCIRRQSQTTWRPWWIRWKFLLLAAARRPYWYCHATRHMAHYVKTRCHPQNQKYITFCIVVRGGPTTTTGNINLQKISWRLTCGFSWYASKHRNRQTDKHADRNRPTSHPCRWRSNDGSTTNSLLNLFTQNKKLLLKQPSDYKYMYIALCLLCSVDIFIAYAMSFFCFSIFMINNDLCSVMIILWLVCDNVVSTV